MSSDKTQTPPPDGTTTGELIMRMQSPEVAPYWLRALIESADDAVISKTLEGIVTSWNKGAERIFGYTADEMIGKPVTILIPPDHPDEEPNILARLRRGERIEHYETVRLRKDGSLVDISLTVSPIIGPDGTITGASKIARDITDRKRAEEALRQSEQELTDFFENAVVSLHWVGPDGTILRANRAELELLGYTAEEYLGHHISEFHADPEVISDILQRLQAGEVLHEYEARLCCKDGSIRHVLIDSSALWESSQFVHTRCFTRDITDKKRNEAEREYLLENERRARREAEEASRLKDEFLATVSHELRTPLTAILGWVRMLRDGSLDDATAQKALESVDRNVRSQAQLIEDLLDISKIVSGKMHLEVRPVEPASVINSAVEAVKPAAQAKGVGLQLIIDPSVGPVAGDYERLQQVVWNLLSNAVKFTPSGGRVLVRTERVGSTAQLTVTDNGRGIKPDFLPYVFDRFRQADSSITRAFGGMGVGLAIVKSIVEMHGGTVEASSEGEGRGASFTVSLPLASETKDTNGKGTVEHAARGTATLRCPTELAGLRILVADDEPDTCAMVRAAFEQCGSKVKTVNSGAEVLEVLEEWQPDVLVADISMPEMDGYQLIRRLRERGAQAGGRVPAVALSAMARVEDRVKALSAGYQMHVSKPVELDELRAVVASLVSVVVKGA
jgi:PAS domain S-box-containing protein